MNKGGHLSRGEFEYGDTRSERSNSALKKNMSTQFRQSQGPCSREFLNSAKKIRSKIEGADQRTELVVRRKLRREALVSTSEFCATK